MTNLQALLEQPANKRLNIKLQLDAAGVCCNIALLSAGRPGEPDDAVYREDFNVEVYGLDRSNAEVLAVKLKRIFARIPVELHEASVTHKQWALTAALRICSSGHAGFRLSLPTPQFNRAVQPTESKDTSRSRIGYAYDVDGYNPHKKYAWSLRIKVDIGTIDKDSLIPTADSSTVAWRTASPVQADFDKCDLKARSGLSLQDFELAYSLVQHLAVKYLGFVGLETDCTDDAKETAPSYWSEGKVAGKGRAATARRYDGAWDEKQSIWYARKYKSWTTFQPSMWMERRMLGGRLIIIVKSIEPERTYPVAKAILVALRDGHPEDVVWGIGAAVADEYNRASEDDADEIAITDNDGSSQQLCVCPSCLKLVVESKISTCAAYTYLVCTTCQDEMRLGEGDEVEGGIIGVALLYHLKIENKHMGGKKTVVQLRHEANEIMRSLRHMFLADGRTHDAYIDQLCDINAPRFRAWDTNRLNIHLPTVDAIYLFVVGQDGLTHYHDPSNVTITSYAANRCKGGWPLIIMEAIRLFLDAAKLEENEAREAHEQALAIMRRCAVIPYELGDLGSKQQSKRIGQLPPPNAATLQESLRTAELPVRSVPNKKVWRFLENAPEPTEERASWRPQQFKWMLFQLEAILEEVFKDEMETYRSYMFRNDLYGCPVFFPFSKYSVVEDFSWRDLYDLFVVKTVRNITVCQGREFRKGLVPIYTADELILVVANLWARMLKADIDNNMPLFDLGRDGGGLIPHPTLRTILCASVGHREHGVVEKLGLQGYDPQKMERVVFLPEECGMLWETQVWNIMKHNHHTSQVQGLRDTLHKIRRGGPPGEIRPLLPAKVPRFELVDEFSVKVSSTTQPPTQESEILDPKTA